MATVLECTSREQRCVLHILWAKGFNSTAIHKEMFPGYGGKGLWRTAVHNWVEKRGKHFVDYEEVETEVRRWLRQQSKTSVLQVSTHWNEYINVCGGFVKK
jgi:hypothetical protein